MPGIALILSPQDHVCPVGFPPLLTQCPEGLHWGILSLCSGRASQTSCLQAVGISILDIRFPLAVVSLMAFVMVAESESAPARVIDSSLPFHGRAYSLSMEV